MRDKNSYAKNRPKSRWARGAPIFLLVLLIVGLFSVVAYAAEPEAGDASFYQMSSVGSAFLNDAFARGDMSGVTVSDNMAGGLLGYCDALDEDNAIMKWLHSSFSNSAISFSYDSFADSSMVDVAPYLLSYCKFGETLHLLGLDKTGAEGAHIMRAISGLLLEGVYTLSICVPLLFKILFSILWALNPFRFINYTSSFANITDLDYYSGAYTGTGKVLLDVDGPAGFRGIASLLSTIYGWMYHHMTTIILTLAFAILVANLIFSNDRGAFKKILTYVKRVCIMFLVVPICAMLYTEGLKELQKEIDFTMEYGINHVVLSTLFDFESWAKATNLSSPGAGKIDLKLANSRNRVQDSSMLNLRSTVFNINVYSWRELGIATSSDFGGRYDLLDIGSSLGRETGVNFMSWNQKAMDPGESASGDSVKAIYDLFARYISGTFYYASSYESDFKKNISYTEIQETIKNTGTKVSTFRDKGSEYVVPDNKVWGVSGNPLAKTPITTKYGTWDFSEGGGLSPMAMYNYLSSSFDDSNVRVYSNEKSSSGFIRDNHFSVNLIGSGMLDSGLYWFNAFVLFGSVSVLGYFFALSLIFGNIKRSFLMYPHIFATTFGGLQAGARLVGHTVLLIVETLVTAVAYIISVDFLMSMNSIIEQPLVRALTSRVFSNGVTFGVVVTISLFLNSIVLIIFVIIALRCRKAIIKTIDESVTRFVDRLFGVQSQPTPDTPSLGSRLAGGLAQGLGAGAASKFLGGDNNESSNVKGTAIDEDGGDPPPGGGGDGGDGGPPGGPPGGPGGPGGGGGAIAPGEEAESTETDTTEEAGSETDDLPDPGMGGESDEADSDDREVSENIGEDLGSPAETTEAETDEDESGSGGEFGPQPEPEQEGFDGGAQSEADTKDAQAGAQPEPEQEGDQQQPKPEPNADASKKQGNDGTGQNTGGQQPKEPQATSAGGSGDQQQPKPNADAAKKQGGDGTGANGEPKQGATPGATGQNPLAGNGGAASDGLRSDVRQAEPNSDAAKKADSVPVSPAEPGAAGATGANGSEETSSGAAKDIVSDGATPTGASGGADAEGGASSGNGPTADPVTGQNPVDGTGVQASGGKDPEPAAGASGDTGSPNAAAQNGSTGRDPQQPGESGANGSVRTNGSASTDASRSDADKGGNGGKPSGGASAGRSGSPGSSSASSGSSSSDEPVPGRTGGRGLEASGGGHTGGFEDPVQDTPAEGETGTGAQPVQPADPGTAPGGNGSTGSDTGASNPSIGNGPAPSSDKGRPTSSGQPTKDGPTTQPGQNGSDAARQARAQAAPGSQAYGGKQQPGATGTPVDSAPGGPTNGTTGPVSGGPSAGPAAGAGTTQTTGAKPAAGGPQKVASFSGTMNGRDAHGEVVKNADGTHTITMQQDGSGERGVSGRVASIRQTGGSGTKPQGGSRQGPSMGRMVTAAALAHVAQTSNNSMVQAFGNGAAGVYQAELTQQRRNGQQQQGGQQQRGGQYVERKPDTDEAGGSTEREDKDRQAANMARSNKQNQARRKGPVKKDLGTSPTSGRGKAPNGQTKPAPSRPTDGQPKDKPKTNTQKKPPKDDLDDFI